MSALPAWRVIRLAFDPPAKDASAEEKLASEVRNVAVFNGPNFLPPDAELRERVRQLADRCSYPPGMLRQFDAVLGTGSLLGYSKAITAPTVVLHGSADPMVRPRNGRAVAAAIPGARFVVVDGMGHDLPEPVWRPIIETLTENFAVADARRERAHTNWDLTAPVWQTAGMSSTKHREVAKLDRVPLPVEAARVAVTGWQVTRTAARVVSKLPGKGPWQQKVIKQLPQTFADLGPTYVKFGQIIASSPGAFGESLSREFRGLLDRVPPADTDEVHKLFVEELGGDPAELFAKWDEEPFASASIAQVHYATLHSGEEVVVKIQRPGIRRRVAADLQILKRFAQAVELAKLGRRLSAQDVVADFSDNLAEELNFRLEAQSMEAWVSHLHASPLGKNIRVPQVHWDFTSDRVLTMERVHGIRIDDVAAIRKAGFDGTELVKALLFSLFEGGLRHGLFHGDLHAGNLYVDDAGPHRVLRLRDHGPHRSPHPLAAARAGVRAAGEEGPRLGRQDRRADGRRRHHEARGRGRQGPGEASPPR